MRHRTHRRILILAIIANDSYHRKNFVGLRLWVAPREVSKTVA